MAIWPRRKLHESQVSHGDKPSKPSTRELGSTGQTQYGAISALPEYNPELRGPIGLKVYDQMRKGDGQVKGVLRLVKAPILAAQWYVEPASQKQIDIDAADFVFWNLNNMHKPFIDFVSEALIFLDFGYYLFEKVWEEGSWTPSGRERERPRAVTKLSKFAPRHPMSIWQWEFDEVGDMVAVEHMRNSFGRTANVRIPADKLLVFTLDEESGNPEGTSILRSAYKHWYYKENLYKIDAIQKERHGIGIPHIKLPPNFTEEDKTLANELGENLRTNEKAHVVTPPNWELQFLEIRTNPADALKSAEHHDLMIARQVLGQFINLGSEGSSGGGEVGRSQMELFVKSLRYLADLVRGELNTDVVPQLCDYNFKGLTAYPQVRVRRIGDAQDWRVWSVALRNFVDSGIVTPDAELEKFIRDQMDLPLASDEAMERTFEDRVGSKKDVGDSLSTDQNQVNADGAGITDVPNDSTDNGAEGLGRGGSQ